MRIINAIRVFFATLFNAQVAAEVEKVLGGAAASEPAKIEAPKPKKPESKKTEPKKPVRSEAVTLLSALQLEARFIDFIKEPLAEFSDAQIGAVARDVHRDCGKVIERMFDVKPVTEDQEGSPVEVPAGFDAGCYRLTGNVTGEPPFSGTLRHHGWKASICELPSWSGSDAAAKTIAPVEVEI